jgi:hypothetical protein
MMNALEEEAEAGSKTKHQGVGQETSTALCRFGLR